MPVAGLEPARRREGLFTPEEEIELELVSIVSGPKAK